MCYLLLMRWIAHRGNLTGPNPARENAPDYILAALASGFEVEVDVWWSDGAFYLGHDAPVYQVDSSFFEENRERFWCHAKNAAALSRLLYSCKGVHVFSHDLDPVVLTSQAIPWAYPGQPLDAYTICVMPERVAAGVYTLEQLKGCRGICSDYIKRYQALLADS